MTDGRLRIVNQEVRIFLREFLPWRWRWLGRLMRAGLWLSRGSGYFDSCDRNAAGASPQQLVEGRCRHGLKRPYWMR